MVVCGRSNCVSVRAGTRLVAGWSTALAGRAGVASPVGANVVACTLGGGMAAVPRIMRAYCEGEILGPMSHSRFVVNSPIKFTDSDTGLAAQGNDARRGRSPAEELAPCSAGP